MISTASGGGGSESPRQEGRGPGTEEEGGGSNAPLPDACIEREEIWAGRVVRLGLDTVRFPDGTTGRLELIRHPGASAVLPFLDPLSDPDPRVVLIRQYRYAAGGPIFEVPAGIPDSPEESWEDCARRELLEETGFQAGELRYMSRIFTTPGFTDEVIHLFAALDLAPGDVQPDADEFIEVVTLPFSMALKGVERGEIVDAKSICTLLFAASFPGIAGQGGGTPPSRTESG